MKTYRSRGSELILYNLFIKFLLEMSHEIFLVYAREDAAFAKILAKGMERYNISVLYKDSLASTRCFKTAIVEGKGRHRAARSKTRMSRISRISFLQLL